MSIQIRVDRSIGVHVSFHFGTGGETVPDFLRWTPDGHLRRSSFAGLRDDKEPGRIVREE
jgi:hypothetical protein